MLAFMVKLVDTLDSKSFVFRHAGSSPVKSKMIQTQTYFRVLDNSGAKKAKCIKIIGKSGKSTGEVGDLVILSIKKLRRQYKKRVKRKIKKSDVHYGVIIQTQRFFKNYAGIKLRFNQNSTTIVSAKGKPLCTRIFTTLPKILRSTKWSKLGSMSKGYV